MRERIADQSVDAVLCDPPYGLGFMGKAWDALPPGLEWAREVFRVLKPGAHVVAFGGTRTVHRLTCALEDAGFEIRDAIHYNYASGFPKSLDVSKALDRAAGAEREVVGTRITGAISPNGRGDGCAVPTYGSGHTVIPITAPATEAAKRWAGYGTALKPAIEPAILARAPFSGTVADCVEKWGTAALNIDGCRFAYGDPCWPFGDDFETARAKNPGRVDLVTSAVYGAGRPQQRIDTAGRWPANIYHCPKPSIAEREAGCAGLVQRGAGELTDRTDGSAGLDSPRAGAGRTSNGRGNHHPTVKPLRLFRWLARLVGGQPGSVILDPFGGSGTTLLACEFEGFNCITIEREAEYMPIIAARFTHGMRILRRLQSGESVNAEAAQQLARQGELF